MLEYILWRLISEDPDLLVRLVMEHNDKMIEYRLKIAELEAHIQAITGG